MFACVLGGAECASASYRFQGLPRALADPCAASAKLFQPHCERSEANHRSTKHEARSWIASLRCARMRKQAAFVVGPAVIPAKTGIQYAAACRLIISSSAILDRPPSRAMTEWGREGLRSRGANAPEVCKNFPPFT